MWIAWDKRRGRNGSNALPVAKRAIVEHDPRSLWVGPGGRSGRRTVGPDRALAGSRAR